MSHGLVQTRLYLEKKLVSRNDKGELEGSLLTLEIVAVDKKNLGTFQWVTLTEKSFPELSTSSYGLFSSSFFNTCCEKWQKAVENLQYMDLNFLWNEVSRRILYTVGLHIEEQIICAWIYASLPTAPFGLNSDVLKYIPQKIGL